MSGEDVSQMSDESLELTLSELMAEKQSLEEFIAEKRLELKELAARIDPFQVESNKRAAARTANPDLDQGIRG